MRSTSGALVERIGETVLKVGEGTVGERVGREARWLVEHANVPCLPRVYAHWDHGYVMEPLVRAPWISPDFDWECHVETCLQVLNDQVWSHTTDREVPFSDFYEFIERRCAVGYPEVWSAVSQILLELSDVWYVLPRVLTHGDPTFDNQCLRPSTGEVVFIDPNPNEHVPSFRASDIACVLQSLHGYEHLKYGAPRPRVTPDYVRDFGIADLEWYASRALCLAKFVRLLSYETHLRPVFREVIDRLLEEEDWTPSF